MSELPQTTSTGDSTCPIEVILANCSTGVIRAVLVQEMLISLLLSLSTLLSAYHTQFTVLLHARMAPSFLRDPLAALWTGTVSYR